MKKMNKVQRISVLMFFITISVLSDYVLVGPYGFITVLAPSLGLILAYHMFYKDALVQSLITYGIVLFLSRLILLEIDVEMAIFISVFKTFVMFCMMVLADHIIRHLKDNGYDHMNLRDILNYIFIGVFVSFIGATLHLLPIVYLFDYDKNMFWYGNMWIGYMFGFFIFGGGLSFAFINDNSPISRKGFYLSILYVFITIFISLILFSHAIPGFDHYNYSYLLFILYMMAVMFLNFRVIFLFNFIIFSSYSLFYYDHGGVLDLSTELFSIILILLVLTAVSVLVKYSYIQVVQKELESNRLKDSMKDIMVETSTILKNIERISTRETYSKEFLIKMFRIGSTIVEKYDKASLYIRDPKKMEYIDSIGYDLHYLNDLNLTVEDFDWHNYVPKIIDVDKELYSNVFLSNNEYMSKYPVIKQSIRFTVMFNNQPVAGMSFDITEGNKEMFDEEDLDRFNELSQMINSFYGLVVIQDTNNAFRNDIVISLVRALGLYDSYTGKHSEEVAYLSMKVAEKLNLPSVTTQRIYWSAIVHDIGKIGISPATISKVGLLTIEERKEVEQHCNFGFDILSSVEGLKDVAIRVKHHHERWDGKGYPDGLKEDEIPLCSQILAVCDAVSAMSRNRSYSKAKTVDGILEELHKERGRQFSPVVCDAMIEYIKESRLIGYFVETS